MASKVEQTTIADSKKQIDLAFYSPRTSLQRLQQTAAYAEDPLAYLTKTLGPETVRSRRHLLSILESLPLQSDFYGTGEHKDHFEQHIATLFGKSHGLFFATGVQAQAVACKIYATKANNPLMAWHAGSHLEHAEQKTVTTLFRLQRVLLGANPDTLPTISDIESIASLPQPERPAMILLELPNASVNCETYTFSNLEEISRMCKDAGIALHCDGARIWEVEPYYKNTDGKSFTDIAALFDSVYVSMYKGLGGSSGAMLLSSDPEFMLAARTWQRRAGGSPVNSMYELIDCERGFNENIGTFEAKWLKTKEVVEGITCATEKFEKDGKPIVEFRPRVPTCCIVFIFLHGFSTDELNAARDRVLEKTRVKVFGNVRRVDSLKKTFDEMMQQNWRKSLKISQDDERGNTNDPETAKEVGAHRTAYTFYAPELCGYDTSLFVEAWTSFCEELS